MNRSPDPGARLTTARRLPLPLSAPPFDDERDPVASASATRRPDPPWARATPPPTQGALALSFTLPGGIPAEPEASSELRLMTSGSTAAGQAAGELPDPARWTARLAQAMVESLYGPRPVQQLLRWTDDRVYRGLAARAAARPAGSGHMSPQLRALRLCRVDAHTAEAAVVMQLGRRCRAISLRLVADSDRWVCVSFDII